MDIIRLPYYLEVDSVDDFETDVVVDLILDEDMLSSKAKKA